MAIHSNQKEQLIEALIENIYAIEQCILFDKEKKKDWEYGGSGILGIPSLILLCSVIDTIGSYFRGSDQEITIDGSKLKIETASEHFLILNHEKFFNLQLTRNAIDDFYSTYRSKLTHNNSLPANNFLSIGKDQSESFEFDSNNLIQIINIRPLFGKTTDAVGQFLYYLTNSTFSDNHKLTKELVSKAKNTCSTVTSSDTGHTQTIITE